MSSSREDALIQKIEALREKMRTLPRGSDLCGFLDHEVTEFARLLRQDLTDQRQESASTEADFSPSGLPPLPQRENIVPGPAAAPGSDDPR